MWCSAVLLSGSNNKQGVEMASLDYWQAAVEEVFGEHGISATPAQIISCAKDFNGCAEVEGEYSGRHQIDPVRQENPLKKRVEQLEEMLRLVGDRFNVGIDVDNKSIIVCTPVGTSHWSNHPIRLG